MNHGNLDLLHEIRHGLLGHPDLHGRRNRALLHDRQTHGWHLVRFEALLLAHLALFLPELLGSLRVLVLQHLQELLALVKTSQSVKACRLQ